MTYNYRKLKDLSDWARESAQFDLRYYAAEQECGTTLCLAGKTVVDAGYQIVWPPATFGVIRQSMTCHQPGMAKRRIKTVAQEELGLNRFESEKLFVPDIVDRESAVEFEDNDELNALEVRQKLDFMDHLLRRVQLGMDNMGEEEVRDWSSSWRTAHGEDIGKALRRAHG